MHNATIPLILSAAAGVAIASPAMAANLSVCAGHCRFETIQSAVDAAHSGDTIQIASGTYFENLVIDGKTVTLRGTGEDTTVIDGQFHGPVVTLGANDEEPTHTVTIFGVTITHGSGQFGGGISVLGSNLDLQFSVVSSNKSSQNGGGIDIEIPAGSGSKISNCLIVHNSAASLGGGVRVSGEAVAQISNSTISRNSAGLRGGGLHGEGHSSTTVTGTTFSDNSSKQDGGGLYIEGGEPDAILNLTRSSVVNNTAVRNGGGIAQVGLLSLTDAVISLNQAGGNGGGLFGGGPKLTVAGTTVIVGNHPNNCSESGCP